MTTQSLCFNLVKMRNGLVMLFMLLTFSTWSQIYEEIDFSSNKEVIKSIKKEHNKPFGIIIKNINKKIYNISLDNSSDNYHVDYNMFLENISEISAPVGEEPTEPVVAANSVAGTKAPLISANIIQVITKEDLVDKINALNKLYNEIRDLKDRDKDNLTSIKDLHLLLFDLRNLEDNIEDLSYECSMSLDNMKEKLKIYLTEFRSANRTYLINLKNNYPEITTDAGQFFKRLSREAYSSMRVYKLNYDRSFSDMNKRENSSKIDSMYRLIKIIQKEVKGKQLGGYNDINTILKYSVVSDMINAYETNYVYADQFDIDYLTNAYLMLDTRDMRELVSTIDYFNESNFSYVVPPQVLDKDIHKFEISIIPKDSIKCDAPLGYINYVVKTKNGLKIDISSGIIANMDWFGFESRTFRKVEVNEMESMIVANENRNILFPTIGAFAHIYRRSGTNFNWGGVFGVSTNSLGSLGFHPGISFIFGSKQRIILNTGVTIGQVSLLAEPFNEVDLFPSAMVPDNVTTSNFFRPGMYFAIAYNL